MSAIQKIHVLKSQAKLDEDTYRDLLEQQTGKRSSKGMSQAEHLKVIAALEQLPRTVEQKPRATGPFAKKLQALWIAGYNLGVIDDNSDAAMMKFLKRQTGLDHHRFLVDASEANKAIDALKLWIRRVTLNDGLFVKDAKLPPLYNDYRFQVCIHIWSELIKRDRHPAETLTSYLYSISGKNDPLELGSNDWIKAMNRLGKLNRQGRK